MCWSSFKIQLLIECSCMPGTRQEILERSLQGWIGQVICPWWGSSSVEETDIWLSYYSAVWWSLGVQRWEAGSLRRFGLELCIRELPLEQRLKGNYLSAREEIGHLKGNQHGKSLERWRKCLENNWVFIWMNLESLAPRKLEQEKLWNSEKHSNILERLWVLCCGA